MLTRKITIVGLGNPGAKYQYTRHNFGFLTVEALALKFNDTVSSWQEKKDCRVAKGLIEPHAVQLVLPQTFMNNSGPALRNSLDKNIAENMLVVHDELDLPFGEMKLQRERSAAGHNGVQSIIDTFGTKNFWRLRLGIGHTPKADPAEQFVLEKFTAEEKKQLPELINLAIQKITEFIQHNDRYLDAE